VQTRDLAKIGRLAEEVAFDLLLQEYPLPVFKCDWRQEYLDSTFLLFREHGLIADIDIWDAQRDKAVGCIEVKAQKVGESGATDPQFYLSHAEAFSWQKAHDLGLRYEVWLFQYGNIDDLREHRNTVYLLIYKTLNKAWCEPATLWVRPTGPSTHSFEISWE
jgi:hypothetical protein